MLDTGRELAALRTDRSDMALGTTVQAQTQAIEAENTRRRVLSWRFAEAERTQARERA